VFVYGTPFVMSDTMVIMVTEIPVPPWKRTRTTAPARIVLTRDLIVDAALRLLDRDGLDGVSMRRVADELGTGAASLYAHVANKEELLDLVLDQVVGEVEVPDENLRALLVELLPVGMRMYEVYGAHNDIAAVSLANIPATPNALRAADRLFAIMLAGGVPARVAGWALDRLALYVAADAYEGSILLKRQRESGMNPQEFMDDMVHGYRRYYASLPADQFPTITAHLEDLSNGTSAERFAFGLDMLIRSLATYVPAAAGPDPH